MIGPLQRIYGMVLRHVYLWRRSWVRVLETAYWPTMNMVLWGFIAKFFSANSPLIAQVPALLISGLLLWEVLFRGQIAFALAFLEELYSRNLGHLFVSPLRPTELIASMVTVSFLRTCVGVGVAASLAIALYAASIFDLGLPLVAFFFNLLVTGWAVGLMVAALVLRYGLAAENLAWGTIFILAPISGIYYPISVLPDWLQNVARCLPTSYVFEGMRAVLLEGVFKWDLFAGAVALNVVYVFIGAGIFFAAFRGARRRGALLQMGE